MIDFREKEILIVEDLKSYLNTKTRPCEVVRQNQVSPVPPYPYVSYTLTTPMSGMTGTYSETEDGIRYRDILQTWSFTSQSDDQDEALMIAMKIFDYFSAVGKEFLGNNGVSVRRVRDITTRDNFITIQYEYRNGLDVTFGLLYEIAPDPERDPDAIKTYSFKEV